MYFDRNERFKDLDLVVKVPFNEVFLAMVRFGIKSLVMGRGSLISFFVREDNNVCNLIVLIETICVNNIVGIRILWQFILGKIWTN